MGGKDCFFNGPFLVKRVASGLPGGSSKRWHDAIMVWSGSFRLDPSLAERDGFVLRQGTIHL